MADHDDHANDGQPAVEPSDGRTAEVEDNPPKTMSSPSTHRRKDNHHRHQQQHPPPNAEKLVGNLVNADDNGAAVVQAKAGATGRGGAGRRDPAARGGRVVPVGVGPVLGVGGANPAANAPRRRQQPQAPHGRGGNGGEAGNGGNAVAAAGGGVGGFIPRTVLHLPEWASPAATAISRSWKMSLLVVGCVGAVGIGSALYSTGSNSSNEGSSAFSIRGGYSSPSLSITGSAPPTGAVELDSVLDLFGDFQSEPRLETDVPFFWDVPLSGGKYMMEIMSKCMGSVLAGNMPGYDNDSQLSQIQTDSGKYINVDTYTHEGILRAHNLGLVDSNQANIILSPLPYHAASLFNPSKRGRMITLLQNPVDRIYGHYSHATGPDCNGNIETCYSPALTLRQYIEGETDRPEFNWMTKTLSGKPQNFLSSELTQDDLNIAKEFLRKKCIVGMLENKGDALLRFKIYFQWFYPNGVCQCVEKGLFWGWPKQDSLTLEQGSDAFENIKLRNSFDMDLYLYAKQLSEEQFNNYFYVNNGV